ncbi:flavin reductase family protein [Nocardioides sp.]|uniref:flavin reductase family protein n=1 Tax=Nocardioides sp. TaxID=35761 RepID=UPI003569BF57
MRTVIRCDDPEVDPYRWLTSLVLPRPIAWISSVGADGVANLAPHSFFSVACAHPPIVSFTSVGDKDTLANVRATGEFVVNLATLAMLELVNNTSARFAPDVDEAAALGICVEPSTLVTPMRVTDSPASLECRLHSTQTLGDSTLVLGEVLAFSVREEMLVDGRPDASRLRPLSRLGGNLWGLPPDPVAVRRPVQPDEIV